MKFGSDYQREELDGSNPAFAGATSFWGTGS
jgi:hypothetical protein